MRTRIVLNLALILLLVGLTAYAQHLVTEITETFASRRVSEVKIFSKLVRDNWDGIASIPDEKKKVLLENLDPALASVDLQIMRTLMLSMFYVFVGGVIVGRVAALYRLWKRSKSNHAATELKR